MYRKKEASYGVLAVFIIVSALLTILMLPFEPITTYAVINQTDSAYSAQSGFSGFVDFVMQNYLLIIVVFVILALALACIIFLMTHKKHADDVLSAMSPKQLEDLASYIKSTMAQGYTKEQVKKALKDAGWQEKVSEAILTKF
ncbi:MAG: hypothetical protein NT001_02185 [Candidatus Woesearchaeota archaeon]|nr:hypothetical protein [Candidatus Woesearchaeota archaeon]